jgi:cobalt-zinc-cadmium efflux system protein
MTFGLKRVEILSAQVNGVTLLVLAAVIGIEAVRRLIDPPSVEAGLVLFVALAGIAINLTATAVLAGANRESLNVEGSYQHILTDLYAFIGTLIAGVVIIFTGFDRADAIASLVVAALMFRSGFQLQRKAARVLLEGAPEGMSPAEVGMAMAHGEHVKEVHDLHVWELAPGQPLLTAHVLVTPHVDCHAVRRALEQMLKRQFKIEHTTLQVDHAPEPLLSIRRTTTSPVN